MKTRIDIARTLKGTCRCGKIRYPSRNEAKLALASCRGSSSHNRHELREYQCRFCGAWHLTSKPLQPSIMTPEEYRRYIQRYNDDHAILSHAWQAAKSKDIRRESDVRTYAVAVMKVADETGDPDRFLINEDIWTMTINRTRPKVSLTSRVNAFRPVFESLRA